MKKQILAIALALASIAATPSNTIVADSSIMTSTVRAIPGFHFGVFNVKIGKTKGYVFARDDSDRPGVFFFCSYSNTSVSRVGSKVAFSGNDAVRVMAIPKVDSIYSKKEFTMVRNVDTGKITGYYNMINLTKNGSRVVISCSRISKIHLSFIKSKNTYRQLAWMYKFKASDDYFKQMRKSIFIWRYMNERRVLE